LRIRDTLYLGELYASDAIVREIRGREDIEVLGEAELVFEGGEFRIWM